MLKNSKKHRKQSTELLYLKNTFHKMGVYNTTMSTPTGTVTALDALPNEIRWQNTGALIIPETVSSTVDGEVQQIPVAWEADHELKTQGCSRLIAEDTTLSRNILIF